MDTVRLTDDQWRVLMGAGYTDARTVSGINVIVAMHGHDRRSFMPDWPRVILDYGLMQKLSDYGEQAVRVFFYPSGVNREQIIVKSPPK